MKSDIQKVDTTCNNCGSAQRELITTGSEHEYDNTTDDVFNVVRCTNCGLAYLNPRPDVSELATIYPANYYAYAIEENYDESQRQNLYFKVRYSRILAGLEYVLSFCKGDKLKILDIGCADGHILNWFRKVRTHDVETYGVDLNEAAIAKARSQGHTVYAGRFEEVDIPEGHFDFVWASHVIEHVADPKAFTEKVYRILKPGGIFWFWTPNIGSLDARLFKNKHWGAYHFPRHWVFYDERSVTKLAEITGFEVVKIDYQPNAIFWVWTFHSLLKNNPLFSKWADTLFPPIDWAKTNLANLIRNASFAGLDSVIKAITGQTSNMGVAFHKPDRG